MSLNITDSNSSDFKTLPHFQQLQMQFAAHIRDPENCAYNPVGEKAIEERRLKVYAELFFNNLHDLFSQVFPVCKAILGQQRWQQITREYLIKHQAQTPLFHHLAEEFLAFIESEFEPLKSDPAFLLELAHYEWVELALAVSEEVDFSPQQLELESIDLDKVYELSPLAWPLAYEWPVHQLSEDYQPTEKPLQVTTLLVYRSFDEDGLECIDFMELTPMLYQWLMAMSDSKSASKALEQVTQAIQIDKDQLNAFAKTTLQALLARGIIR